jgi:hypothetical protein
MKNKKLIINNSTLKILKKKLLKKNLQKVEIVAPMKFTDTPTSSKIAQNMTPMHSPTNK